MDQSGDAQAVLGLLVLNAVAAGDNRTGLQHLGGAAGQNIAHRLHRKAGGEGQQIHGQGGRAAHGVYVGESIGGGDLTKGIGVVHHRGEEVHRLDHGYVVTDLVDGGVVAGVITHQQVGVRRFGQARQYIP